MNYFFIVDSVGSSDKNDLPVGPRVFFAPEDIVLLPHPSTLVRHKSQFLQPLAPLEALFMDDGDGPYESIRQLKENSEIYRSLLLSNPKRANKIFEEQYLIPFNEGGYAAYKKSDNEEFENQIYDLLKHTIVGSINRNDVSGIHYFDPDRVKIIQEVGLDEKNGVWQAYVEVYNSNADRWVAKREPATFFPKSWDYSRIVEECQYAYTHRVKLTSTKWKGITQSDVLIVFIYDQTGKLKTLYPICEEL